MVFHWLVFAIGELARSCCEVYVYDKNEDNLQQVHHRLQGQRAQLIEDNLLAADEAFSVRFLSSKVMFLTSI